MTGSGLLTIEMEKVFKFGLMVQDTKENGRIIKHVEKVNFAMLMGMNLKGTGGTTKQTDMESIFM